MLNFCPNCGKSLHGGESYCGHCGCRLGGIIHQNKLKTGGSSSNTWIIVCTFLVIAIGVYMFASVDTNNHTNTSAPSPSLFKKELSQGEIQSIKDKETMQRALVNTVWTYTETGNLFWSKLVFKEKTVLYYSAMPSDGKWTFEEECPYTLEEGRFIDDGRKYIAAVIKSKDMSIFPKFVITNGHLSWLGIIDAGGFVLGDYEWD